mgnify:CR=1 FL=1
MWLHLGNNYKAEADKATSMCSASEELLCHLILCVIKYVVTSLQHYKTHYCICQTISSLTNFTLMSWDFIRWPMGQYPRSVISIPLVCSIIITGMSGHSQAYHCCTIFDKKNLYWYACIPRRHPCIKTCMPPAIFCFICMNWNCWAWQ